MWEKQKYNGIRWWYVLSSILCICLFSITKLLFLEIIPLSPFGYLFEADYLDFSKWYPHTYFLVYFLIHVLPLLPYLALCASLTLVYRASIVSPVFFYLYVLANIIGAVFFPIHSWLFSSIFLFVVSIFSIRENLKFMEQLSTKRLLIIGVVVALVIRISWIFISDNCDNGDSGARLYVSYLWLKLFGAYPSIFGVQVINPAYDWLPLHFYLTGISVFLTQNVFTAPRILTALFGAFSVIPLYLFASIKFSRNTAIAACIIFIFYLQHIVLSSQVLSEPYYIFFLLWAYYFIEKFIAEGQSGKTASALGFALACCCWLRYEGWAFSGMVVMLILFTPRISTKIWLKIAIPVLIAIVVIMICEVASGLHPLRGILFSDKEVATTYTNGESSYSDILTNLPFAYLPLYGIAMLASFLSLFKTKKRTDIILFCIYWLAVLPFAYKIFNQTLTSQSRYLSIYMVPAIPFIANILEKVLVYLRMNRYTFFFTLTFYILLSNWFMSNKVIQSRRSLRYEEGFLNSATYTRDSISKCQLYLDYANEIANFSWVVYSNTLDIPHIFHEYDSNYYHLNEKKIKAILHREWQRNCVVRLQNKTDFNRKSFDTLLAQNKISHIMLFPEGELNKVLRFSHKREIYNDKEFELLFCENGYRIYKLVGVDDW